MFNNTVTIPYGAGGENQVVLSLTDTDAGQSSRKQLFAPGDTLELKIGNQPTTENKPASTTRVRVGLTRTKYDDTLLVDIDSIAQIVFTSPSATLTLEQVQDAVFALMQFMCKPEYTTPVTPGTLVTPTLAAVRTTVQRLLIGEL